MERYQALVDEAGRAQETYDFLAAKANEAQLKLRQGQNIGYLQVLEPARLPESSEPRRTGQILLLGAVVSLLLAIGLAFVLEALERNLGPTRPDVGSSDATILTLPPLPTLAPHPLRRLRPQPWRLHPESALGVASPAPRPVSTGRFAFSHHLRPARLPGTRPAAVLL